MHQGTFNSHPLNTMLNQELALGNRVVGDFCQWGDLRMLSLQYPFRSSPAALPHPLTRKELNDPHYWKAEITDPTTKEMLVCRFD